MARPSRTIITDFRHLPEVSTEELAARRSLPAFLASIVAAASLEAAHSKARLPLRCRCRPGHRACPGNILITRRRDAPEVQWRCSKCDFNGVISHWQGSEWDLGPTGAPPPQEVEVVAAERSRRRVPAALAGKWRITEAEMWDADAVGQAYLEFTQDGGSLRLIAIEGGLDCHYGEVDGRPSVEFSWMGDDDGEAACGRGWAHLQTDGSLAARIFIHRGIDSCLIATRDGGPPPRKARRRRAH